MLAKYKCQKCGHKFKHYPRPTQCQLCDHIYVDWIDVEKWLKWFYAKKK